MNFNLFFVIDEERLEGTLHSFEDFGANLLGVQMDVSQANQVEELARRTLETFGAVHVLCNNAGVGYGGRSRWKIPLEEFLDIYQELTSTSGGQ